MGDHREGVACAQWDHYRLHKSWALRQGGWWDQETEEDPQDSPHFLQGWRAQPREGTQKISYP